jgi:phospholipid transport system substrate-binding protein
MIHRLFIKTLLLILLLQVAPLPLMAGEPTSQIKTAADKLINIVSDVSLRPAKKKNQRDRKVIDVVDKLLSWDEFSRRVLGAHWFDRTASEKKEFVTLFRQYMVGSYIDYDTCYSGEKISFLREKIDGAYGTVTGEVNISNRIYVPVEFRVVRKDGAWRIYDASVAGLSFVDYYRNQINDIITKSSYKELIKRLKSKDKKGLGQIDLTFTQSHQ